MLKQEPSNRNSLRSIRLIRDTLLSLMLKESFQNISISQITKQAGLVRNTFYSHFQKKEDVLSYHMFDLFKAKIENLNLAWESQEIDWIAIYFEFWSENLEFLELLYKQDLLDVLYSFEFHIDKLHINSYLEDICTISDRAKKYANSVYVNTMASMIRRWITTGKEETNEELTSIFYELFE
ncbi:TetR/AcrR family transcriptional regulator [Spirochaeta cellobiosiphila]|uniref:TetR/AcrR family transcriptional regulator n=1 Tax=Spirochaeta cellobiosiphila TaxID=504483 RepID=UPI00049004B1|nr:TetR/AcrR family transcriptional regulator C-terminal domain-containing protein [Spirochaeta cellobiosiphila]